MYRQQDLLGLSKDETLMMCQKLEDSVGNLRRGLFQRHNDLLQMYLSSEDKTKSHDKQLIALESNCDQIRQEIAAIREEVKALSSMVDQLRHIVQYPVVEKRAKIIAF